MQTKIPFPPKRDGNHLIVLLGNHRPKESGSAGIASPHISVSAEGPVRAPLAISIRANESLIDYRAGLAHSPISPFGIGDPFFDLASFGHSPLQKVAPPATITPTTSAMA
ncbi:hypothetical protein [Achromobacter piechaudii]|uniref:hypothetical protein n=1 Tax=Achromobacter piechaudii TaxID=72556 RepID=UPI001581C949|nr:hypothetical protein [Achromobacter piechaudii]